MKCAACGYETEGYQEPRDRSGKPCFRQIQPPENEAKYTTEHTDQWFDEVLNCVDLYICPECGTLRAE